MEYDDSSDLGSSHPSLEIPCKFRDACSNGDLDVLSAILDELTFAEQNNLLYGASASGSPLFEAILCCQTQVIEFLVSKGYDLEREYNVDVHRPIVFSDRCAALCLACACGKLEVVETLLHLGASVNHTSLNSSPIIYASQHDNVGLISLLLAKGADVTILPTSFHSQSAVLPLYQACINGYKETAELFLDGNANLGLERRICYLGLLGAQCINRHEDFEGGLKYWRAALTHLAELCQTDQKVADFEMARKLKKFYLEGSGRVPGVSVGRGATLLGLFKVPEHSSGVGVGHHHHHSRQSSPEGPRFKSIFGDMRLCTTLEGLESIAEDRYRLTLQAFLILQDVLGLSHPETIQQMSKAATIATDSGRLEHACKLLLYGMESNERAERPEAAAEYGSQLADLLLNANWNNNNRLVDQMAGNDSCLLDILRAATELTVRAMIGIQKKLFSPGESLDSSPAQALPSFASSYWSDHHPPMVTLPCLDSSQIACHSKIKLFTETVEAFMAFLRLLIELDPARNELIGVECVRVRDFSGLGFLREPMSELLNLCHRTTTPYSKFSLESEILKIAVHGGHSTFSTLSYFQEDLFPDVSVLEFLLQCGASMGCVDFQGDTPLHHSLDCARPCREVVLMLLENGADVDVINRQGLTPYKLLNLAPHLLINPFDYLSLKCVAASAIVKLEVPFRGELPKMLETFVEMHYVPRVKRNFKKPWAKEGLIKAPNASEIFRYQNRP